MEEKLTATSMPVYRAWYKEDLKKGNPLLFEQKLIDGELYFINEDGTNTPFTYGFSTPFIDDDWILEECVKREDIHGQVAFVGDIIKITYHGTISEQYEYFVIEKTHPAGLIKLVNCQGFSGRFDNLGAISQFEIVGNIHQLNDQSRGPHKLYKGLDLTERFGYGFEPSDDEIEAALNNCQKVWIPKK